MSKGRQHLTDEIILRFIDREVTSQEADRVRAHLVECSECRERHGAISSTTIDLRDLYRAAWLPPETYRVESRNQLEKTLAECKEAHYLSSRLLNGFLSNRGVGIAVLGLLALAFASQQWSRTWHSTPISGARLIAPNRLLTPGAVRPVTVAEVCSTKSDDLDPEVSQSLQRAVLDEYGVRTQKVMGQYQIDYLINPQLGGTSDIKNLWPEPYSTSQWSAQAKDELERRLQQMVCAGTVDITVAQHEIANNWIAAYKKYMGNAQSSSPRHFSEIASITPHFP